MSQLSIDEVLSKIYEYQRINNIKHQCITNTQIVYNYVKKHFPEKKIKTVVVIVYYDCGEYRRICINHILLKIDDVIIDPSYEYHILINKTYFYSYEDFFLTVYKEGYTHEYMKAKQVDTFLRMLKISTMINISGKPTKNIDYDYYNVLESLLK
jgi:hypothetical protein